MDKSAIERIEELAAHGEISDKYVPAMVMPSGTKVESLEQLLDSPLHQRVAYTTERIKDFCDYLTQEHLTEGHTAVFIKPDGSGAQAIIDFGDHEKPLWGHHRATLEMKYTPEFDALLKASQRDLDQRALTDWLEDWAHCVTPVNGDGAVISIGQAVQTIQRIDIKAMRNASTQIGDFNHERSAMEKIEASSNGTQPPALFRLTAQVYPCTRTRIIEARLSLRTYAEKPSFRLRIIGEDALRKDVAEEIDLELHNRLANTDVRAFVGTVKKS